MIIWRGRGIAIALITFGCLLLAELMTETVFGADDFYQTHGWPKLAGLWSAAVIVYALRDWLRVGEERILIDNETGQEVRASIEGELFFIRAGHWPIVLLGLGLVFLFVTE